MYKEYFKLIVRNIKNNRLYSFINIVGLAVALTAALLIYSHVVKEWKTDRFHANKEHIYRVTRHWPEGWESFVCYPWISATATECPGIKHYTRVSPAFTFIAGPQEDKDGSFHVQNMYADRYFFDIFTFPLITGDLKNLEAPGWAVVSKSMASRIWGERNPVGEPLFMKNCRDEQDKGYFYRVAAVMEDVPVSSTLQADVVTDLSIVKEKYGHWGCSGFYAYFELNEGADIAAIEERMPHVMEENYSWIKADNFSVELQPLTDIYFGSGHLLEEIPHGSKRLNGILCGITLLILLLASCNYVMIKIAGVNRHAARLAMQRCFGAGNRHLWEQLFGETMVHVGLATIIMAGLTVFLHPFFVRIISPKSPYVLHFTGSELFVFGGLLLCFVLLITGILSFYILHHLNRNGIKASVTHPEHRWDIRKVLSVTQICIFSTLLCCSVVLVRQMNFIKNRPLGFDNKNVVQIIWRDWTMNVDQLRSEWMQNPDIISVSNGWNLPLIGENTSVYVDERHPEKTVNSYVVQADEEFIDTYRIKLCEGRTISKESYPHAVDWKVFCSIFSEKTCPEIIVNQKFVEQLELKNPLGTVIQSKDGSGMHFRIVGVAEDFHFLPLYEAIQPIFIVYHLPQWTLSMLVRYREGSRENVLKYLKEKYEEHFSQSEFSYWEYSYSQLYDKDIAMVRLINVFTCITIFISGMGIFAFSMFMAESRRKEVALRKVNGAAEWQIVGLLNRNFITRVFIACVIGLPVAYYAMNTWLENFAYKTELSGWIYLTVFVVSVVFVLLITTWQVWRTASVNPVEVLKNE